MRVSKGCGPRLHAYACSVLMMLRDAMLRIAPQHDREIPVTLRSARSARLEGRGQRLHAYACSVVMVLRDAMLRIAPQHDGSNASLLSMTAISGRFLLRDR